MEAPIVNTIKFDLEEVWARRWRERRNTTITNLRNDPRDLARMKILRESLVRTRGSLQDSHYISVVNEMIGFYDALFAEVDGGDQIPAPPAISDISGCYDGYIRSVTLIPVIMASYCFNVVALMSASVRNFTS